MIVIVHLLSQSKPIKYNNIINCYTKDGMYCIQHPTGVDKYPMVNIFRVKEKDD